MAPPPKRKSRGSSSLLNVFLPEDDWRSVKTQFLKIVDKLTTLVARVDKLEAGSTSTGSSGGGSSSSTQSTQITQITQGAQILSAETLQDLDRLLNPVLGDVLTRVDSRNYKTAYKYENLEVYRSGQEVSSLVVYDGEYNVNFPVANFPTGIGTLELITGAYIKQASEVALPPSAPLTPEILADIQRLLNPVNEVLIRVDNRNYKSTYKYQNLHIYRSGQEVSSLVVLDGQFNVNFPIGEFPTGIGGTELITGSYVKQ